MTEPITYDLPALHHGDGLGAALPEGSLFIDNQTGRDLTVTVGDGRLTITEPAPSLSPGVTLPDESKRRGTYHDGRPLVAVDDIPFDWDAEYVDLAAVNPLPLEPQPRTERVPLHKAKGRALPDGQTILRMCQAGEGGGWPWRGWAAEVYPACHPTQVDVDDAGTIEVLADGEAPQ